MLCMKPLHEKRLPQQIFSHFFYSTLQSVCINYTFLPLLLLWPSPASAPSSSPSSISSDPLPSEPEISSPRITQKNNFKKTRVTI